LREKEKNRILKLHLQEQKGGGASKGGTNTSSSGQYEGNAFESEGPLSVSGRERDLGTLPDEVDITKGSEGFDFSPKIAFITGPGDDDIDIDMDDNIDFIDLIGDPVLPLPTNPIAPSEKDEINRPLSLSCCKKCDNGMYTNRCFPFDSDEDEDCRFPTLEICEDESEPRLPSMLDIFA
tara:strand:+ start:1173 stop:1709 length:537 start_codon:yes stop_codon:yes gene_type:complete